MHMMMCCKKYIFIMREYSMWIYRNKFYTENYWLAEKKYNEIDQMVNMLKIPIRYNKTIAVQIILTLYKTKILPNFLVMNIVFMVTGLYNTEHHEIFEKMNPIYLEYAINNQEKYIIFKKNLVFNDWYNKLNLCRLW